MHTLLIATADATARAFLAAQLDADGHTVHEAGSHAAVWRSVGFGLGGEQVGTSRGDVRGLGVWRAIPPGICEMSARSHQL